MYQGFTQNMDYLHMWKGTGTIEKSGNLINETKTIFKRMDIDVDRLGILPLRAVNFQHIKADKSVIPSLCVTFNNEKIASIVRRKMMTFNSALDEENRLDELRYSERIYWSQVYTALEFLKICWKLKRLKLVEFVNVHTEGIRVQYQVKEISWVIFIPKSAQLLYMTITIL
ncbi:hypothetical protein ACKWTF_007614 [Chironomus riparius]